VVHARVPGRVRLRDPRLCRPTARPEAVAQALLGLPGVSGARVSALTGSVLIRYRAPATVRSLARALDGFLGAGAALAAPAPPPARPVPGRTPRDDPPWHALPVAEVLGALHGTAEHGLSPAEAAARLARYGPNALPRAEARSSLAIFVEQLETLPSALLGTSALVSLFTGGFADAVVILVSPVIN
jgi:Ca2+-transporting ATPase